MFFIKQIGKEVKITPIANIKEDVANITIIPKPEKIFIIGKNNIYDPEITVFNKRNSLSFVGTLIAELEEEIIKENLSLYMLDNQLGYLIKNKKNEIFVSKSYQVLADFFNDQLNISITKLINESENDFRLSVFNINNDFNPSTPLVVEEDIDPNEHSIFNLEWAKSIGDVPYQMVINQQKYSIEEDDHVMVFSGFGLNMGYFRQTILKNPNEVIPIKYKDFEMWGCLELLSFINTDPQNYLVPHVMSNSEYRNMMYDMKQQGRDLFTYSGLSNRGYTVQAEIEINHEMSTNKDIIANLKHLVLIPALFATKNLKAL